MTMSMLKRVLIVCADNATRSRVAEAFMKNNRGADSVRLELHFEISQEKKSKDHGVLLGDLEFEYDYQILVACTRTFHFEDAAHSEMWGTPGGSSVDINIDKKVREFLTRVRREYAVIET